MLGDPLSDLHIILSNKFSLDRKALRLITKFSMQNEWEPCIKTLCDLVIYKKGKPRELREFLLKYHKANFEFDKL